MTVLLVSACTDSNESLIDQKYIESTEYKSFEQKYCQEAVHKSGRNNLDDYLQELGNCQEKAMSFPLKLNKKEISTLLKASKENCEQLINKDFRGFEIYLLKEISQKKYLLKLVLLSRESIYKDWQLFAVTYRDDNLQNFKKIGVVKENLSEDIETGIQVSSEDENLVISSTISRKIIYPLEQKSIINQKFIISSQGIIQNSE